MALLLEWLLAQQEDQCSMQAHSNCLSVLGYKTNNLPMSLQVITSFNLLLFTSLQVLKCSLDRRLMGKFRFQIGKKSLQVVR